MLKECRDNLRFESKLIGTLSVPGVVYQKCQKCGYTLIPYEGAATISSYLREKEAEAINSLPIGDFISPMQAYQILECTKQAFSQNPRIKRGFILSTVVSGKKLYHKRSVELFKAKKDGRFSIKCSENRDVVVKYIVIKSGEDSYYNPSVSTPYENESKWYHQYDVKINSQISNFINMGAI